MTVIANHPQRNTLRLQLRENALLKDMRPEQWEALEIGRASCRERV